MGTQAWMEQVGLVVGARGALDQGPTIGAEAWMIAVGRKLGVGDVDGHGPDLHTDEWRSAIHHIYQEGPGEEQESKELGEQ